jgi:transcriptional regulator with XRE-family HTH domain
MITAEQIKAARALLRMEQDELARRAGVSVTTIRRLEAAAGEALVAGSTASEVQRVLQEAGVEFIHDGVCLKPRSQDSVALFERLYAIAERSAAQQAALPPFTEADLYGDDGLPK